MGQELLETKWDEVLGVLEAEGLPKEKAREVLPKAMGFIFEVNRRRGTKYLAETTLRTRRETVDRLTKIGQKYPGVRGLLAHLYLEEVKKEGKLQTGRILQLCDEVTRIGLVREWIYLGQESRKWRLAGRAEGEVGIHPNVLNAGVHIFDFRPTNPDQRRMRHFLPDGWRNEAQLALTGYLASEVKRLQEEYRAAHPEKFRPNEPPVVELVPVVEPIAVVKPVGESESDHEPRAPKPREKTKGGRAGARAALRNQVTGGDKNE